MYPDVRVVQRGARGEPRKSGGNAVATVPVLVPLTDDEPITEGFIEIRDAESGGKVISVVEVLSPANKVPGPGRDLYRKKQRELRNGRVSLVEIDLIRQGKHVLLAPLVKIPPEHRSPLLVSVLRGWKPEVAEVYPISFRDPLPTIKVPLRKTDADVTLELQVLLDQAYRNGRYGDIDYRKPSNPPLGRADAAWANDLLTKKGLHGKTATRNKK